MRKIILTIVCCLLLVVCIWADDFGDFKRKVAKEFLEPFSKDLGVILAGNSFSRADNLGFLPFPGLEASVRLTTTKVSDDNKILRQSKDSVDDIGIPWFQVEVGLPKNIDFMIRGYSSGDIKVSGFGAKYKIFGNIALPAISVSATYNQFKYIFFKQTTYSANLIISKSLPIIFPYVGIGIDQNKLEVTDADDKDLIGLEVKTSGTRFVGGINLNYLIFYLHLGGSMGNGNSGVDASIGLRLSL